MEPLTYLKNVVTLDLDQDKCTGCGLCLLVCPQEVLSMNGGKAAVVQRDRCMECSACATNCPAGAVTVEPGVGCAAAVINSFFGRKGKSACCC